MTTLNKLHDWFYTTISGTPELTDLPNPYTYTTEEMCDALARIHNVLLKRGLTTSEVTWLTLATQEATKRAKDSGQLYAFNTLWKATLQQAQDAAVANFATMLPNNGIPEDKALELLYKEARAVAAVKTLEAVGTVFGWEQFGGLWKKGSK